MTDNITQCEIVTAGTLTICIPTYNRADVLLEALTDLMPKAKALNIQVVVVDNCSTDNTREIVAEFRTLFPGLGYFCQVENRGFDINVETSLKLSQTDYTLVLGDGNRVDEIYLAEALTQLLKYKPDLYVLNSPRRVSMPPSGTYTSADTLLYDLGWHMTLLSVSIYSRKVIELANFEKYRSTHFMHFGVIFDSISHINNLRVYWDAHPVISHTQIPKKNTWDPFRIIEIFGKAWTEVVKSLPETISLKSKLHCIAVHGKNEKLFTLRKLLKQKAVNGLNKEIYNQYKEYLPLVAPGKKLLILFVLYLPDSCNKYVRRYRRNGCL